PGNPFASVTGSDPREAGITPEMREAAFERPGSARAELILCGHTHVPRAIWRTRLDGRPQLIVRTGAAIGWDIQHGQVVRHGSYAVLTRRAAGWHGSFGVTYWRPRDPDWHWRRPIDELEAAGG